jgi:hypothetical protein
LADGRGGGDDTGQPLARESLMGKRRLTEDRPDCVDRIE